MFFLWTALILTVVPNLFFAQGIPIYIARIIAKDSTTEAKDNASKYLLFSFLATASFALVAAFIADKLISNYQ